MRPILFPNLCRQPGKISGLTRVDAKYNPPPPLRVGEDNGECWSNYHYLSVGVRCIS
jgi:hypothetical protein